MVGPERSGVPDSWAEGTIREAAEGVKELRRWFLGNGSEGVAARFARMDERLKAIEARLAERVDGFEKTALARWKAVGHIAVALVAAASLAMQLLAP
jgi:hypothetical protein